MRKGEEKKIRPMKFLLSTTYISILRWLNILKFWKKLVPKGPRNQTVSLSVGMPKIGGRGNFFLFLFLFYFFVNFYIFFSF